MFVFDNVLTAGTVLVRDQIESQNYTPSGGLAGWAIQSDGDAFFNNAFIRGSLEVGPNPGQHIFIGASPIPQIDFYSGAVTETDPADIASLISNAPVANQPFMNYTSHETGFDSVDFRLGAPMAGNENYGFYFINNSTNGQLGRFQVDSDLEARFANNTNLSAIGADTAGFQIGPVSGLNMAFGAQLIQSRNNGVAVPLVLNLFGGGVVAGDVTGAGRGISINSNDIQAIFGGAGSVLQLNPNGSQVFVQGTLNAAGATAFMSTNGDMVLTNGTATSAGFFTNSGSALGAALIVSGGQMNASVVPPSGAGPGAGTAWWNNTSGTNYRLSRTTSSLRYKENVRDLDGYTEEQILSLVPRWYQRNDHRDYTQDDEPLLPVTESTPFVPGFIAEEAEQLGLISWISLDSEGRADSFSYGEFAAVAHQYVLRAQAKKITELETRLANLERLINGETSSLSSNS